MNWKTATLVGTGGRLVLLMAWLLTFSVVQAAGIPPIGDRAIHGSGGRYSASNAAHGFSIVFGPQGFAISGTTPVHWKWGLELQGIGRGGMQLRPARAVEERAEGNRLEVDHGSFEMQYANGADGMRHDIIVRQRPGGEGRLTARLGIAGGLLPLEAGPDRVVFHVFDPEQARLLPVLDYSGLHVWDAAGATLASRMSVLGGVLLLEVDDRNAVYPITIDPLSSSPDAVISGMAAGDDFGFSVATAGDVNGDGYSDLLVGTPGKNGRRGEAALYYGSATGISATPAWTGSGGAANDEFGYSVSSAGDVNGDGYSDVVIGAPGEAGCGAIRVYHGGPGGLGASPTVRYGDSQAGSRFGHSVALAGDVNGDGFSDVVAGAPYYDKPPSGTDHGKTYLYHGSAAGISFFATWSYTGSIAAGRLGSSVCGAGDLDGDGYSDVAVGAPFDRITTPPQTRGKVYLFRGGPGSLPAAATTVLQGSGTNAEFGTSVAGAGDVNGDGYADLIVGSPGMTTGAGRVDLYLGTSAGSLVTTASASYRSGASGERLGEQVAGGGDLNGDDYADVVVGAAAYSSGRGRVMVFFGNAAGINLNSSPPWSKTGATGEGLGKALGTAGDLNGDGISDLAVRAPGAGTAGEVRIFHGGTNLPGASPAWSVLGGTTYANMGQCVAQAGDVNGDGYGDVLVSMDGVNQRGRVMLFLGSATGLSPTAAWTKDGEYDQDNFGNSVASAGDVNGDGYSDVLIGAPSYPNYAWRGKAYLYLGGPGGLSATPAWTGTGEKLNDRFGWSVCSAGDVNGDGYSDVAIGAYMFRSGPDEVGKVYVYHGSASGLGGTADWTATGSPLSFFGASVSTAGDVNGDGYDDLIIGAHFWDVDDGSGNTSYNQGAAFVHHGSASGLSALPNWSVIGAVAGDELGGSVSLAGDVNGDGYSDVVIGAMRADAPSVNEVGRAYVYHGQPTVGLGAAPATVIEGTLVNDRLGTSVCSAGDMNGDGFSDVLIGVTGADFLFMDQGKAQVHFGGPSGVSATADVSLWGPNATGAAMGNSVAVAGDVNGDGLSDVLVGAYHYSPTATNEGGAYLFMGSPGMSRPTFQYRSNLSTQVRTSNGTFETTDCNWGIGQWAHSSMGRGKLKLAWQYRGHGPGVPSGVLFPNNSEVEPGTVAGEGSAWTDSGLNGVLIKEAVSGPTGSSHPNWRVRVRHHPATAMDGRPFGRWFVQGIHDLQVPSLKTNLVVCGPLPVTLLGNSVACQDGQAVLEWATASEQDCERFVVMRSEDGMAWQPIVVVPGSGSTSHVVHYEARDPRPLPDRIAYYRLDQYDLDGSKTSFPVMVLMPCGTGAKLNAWPNPACCGLFISVDAPVEENSLSAELIDVMGRKVARLDAMRVGGSVFRVEGLEPLPAGAYLVTLNSSKRGLIGQVRMVKD